MAGAGRAPAGTSVGGYGTLAVGVSPNPVPLPDPASGVPQTCRLVNQQTGDYVMLPDGRLAGMPTAAQLVYIALKNNLDFSDFQEKGANFQAKLTGAVQAALSDLIARKVILLQGVVASSPTPDSGLALVSWVDLATGQPGTTTVP